MILVQDEKVYDSSIGKPLLLQDFLFKDKFEGITDVQFQQSIDIVNTMFTGVRTLWAKQETIERQQKINLVLSYMVGWNLLSLYPGSAPGIGNMGSVPLLGKSIDNISLKYRSLTHQEGTVLDSLTTNYFGIQALLMLQSAPEMYQLYV